MLKTEAWSTCVVVCVHVYVCVCVCVRVCFVLVSLACEDLGEMFDNSLPSALFSSFFFLLFLMEVRSRTLIPLF